MSNYTYEIVATLRAVKEAQEEEAFVWVNEESIRGYCKWTEDAELIRRQLAHGLELGLCCNPVGGPSTVWKLRAEGEALV